MNYKLGSLFDGSGGFPLSGALCGVEPCWASEVEPYPIAVTRTRFPNMKHLGDISKINGAEIEPVDIITFGSPCQDLSVAGKRAGLKHEANGDEETTRSGLFMEAVRIIKEMRRATNGKYPRFALWENVPGAFSSNKGEDFRVVCEELIKIVEPRASMPEVPKNGWPYADSYTGDGWSLAYRTFDAQYWGVPQRRRRIHLIADFRGERAREVLFEREGVRGYFAQGRTPWQTAPACAEGRPGADDSQGEGFDGYNGDLTGDVSATLGVNCGVSTGRNGVVERGGGLDDVVPYTLKIRSGCEGGGKGALVQEDKSATLATNNDPYLFQPVIAIDKESYSCGEGFNRKPGITVGGPYATLQTSGTPHAVCYAVESHPQDSRVNIDESGKVQTLTSRMGTGGGNVPMVREEQPVICLQGNGIDRADTAGCNGKGWKEDTSYTLNTIDRPAVVYAVDQQGGKGGANYAENVMPTLCSDSHGTPHGVVYAVDQGDGKSSANVTENKSPTLCTTHGGEPVIALDRASFNQGQNVKYDFEITDSGVNSTIVAKGPSAVAYKTPPRYIVRRLTPTECARLQGFADQWGHIEKKDSLTDEELRFWQEVRDTYDLAIKGKKPEDLKTYTEKQMVTWYNKLHTDSAEYKMWGNGIALPPALYCLQGIVDALNSEEEDDSWLL